MSEISNKDTILRDIILVIMQYVTELLYIESMDYVILSPDRTVL